MPLVNAAEVLQRLVVGLLPLSQPVAFLISLQSFRKAQLRGLDSLPKVLPSIHQVFAIEMAVESLPWRRDDESFMDNANPWGQFLQITLAMLANT